MRVNFTMSNTLQIHSLPEYIAQSGLKKGLIICFDRASITTRSCLSEELADCPNYNTEILPMLLEESVCTINGSASFELETRKYCNHISTPA